MKRVFWPLAALLVLGAAFAFGLRYRLSPLAAVRTAPNVPSPASPFGTIKFRRGEVLLLHTPQGPRTVLVVRQLFLWRATATVYFPSHPNPGIRTDGWMDYYTGRNAVTVLAVTVTNPDIAAIAAGPPGVRRTRPVRGAARQLIFAWHRSISFAQMHAVALSAAGKPLYRYGYPHSSSAGQPPAWYPIK